MSRASIHSYSEVGNGRVAKKNWYVGVCSAACDPAFSSRKTPREEARGVLRDRGPEPDHNPGGMSPKELTVTTMVEEHKT